MFYFTFGVAETIGVTWLDNPRTTEDAQRTGFGQVVAIAMLAIPILTGAKIHNGKRFRIHTRHMPLLTSTEATKVNTGLEEPHSVGDLNDTTNGLYLSPELALSEYEERQRSPALHESSQETNDLHQAMSYELSKQVGIEELSPFRRHLIAYSSLCYTLEERRRLRIRKLYYSSRCRAFWFTVNMYLEIVSGTLIARSNIAAFYLIVFPFAFSMCCSVSDLRRRRHAMESRFDWLQLHRKWLEKHHAD